MALPATAARRCRIWPFTGGQVISEEVGLTLENADRRRQARPQGLTRPISSRAPVTPTPSPDEWARSAKIENSDPDYDRRSCRSGWPSWPVVSR